MRIMCTSHYNPSAAKLQAAGERRPEPLQYLCASFGLTQPLLNFWRRGGYQPVYLRQTASDVTGAGQLALGCALRCCHWC
jgi:tRNA(Met) C34 N-acetyltransferase TmcA